MHPQGKSPRRLSLTARLLLASSIALVGFLGLTGLALENGFQESAATSQRERLEGQLFTLMASVEMSAEGEINVPADLPGPRFSQPGSGRYAAIQGNERRWRSASLLGQDLALPEDIRRGELRFTLFDDAAGDEFRVVSQGIVWEMPDGRLAPFVFHIAESTDVLERQVADYRRALWGWLLAAAALLLVTQIGILWWSLRPLRKISADLADIERGQRDQLEDDGYPSELHRLAFELNALIDSERERLERYRRSLGDLAHSLKTPLAILRSNLAEQKAAQNGLAIALEEQVQRMDDIVAYQLQRAGTSGFRALAKPIEVAPVVSALVDGLEKIHATKAVSCEFDVDSEARFYGSQGDLMELMGNLLENAFKWCQQRVFVEVHRTIGRGGEQFLSMSVSDDGPGIAFDQREKVLNRGVRADEQTPGHGIGLAIVSDIVQAYRGSIDIEQSRLGGALIRLNFERHGMPLD
jgi:two-component system sensor histidine kinase PhoQ